jgi:hypothetical protein
MFELLIFLSGASGTLPTGSDKSNTGRSFIPALPPNGKLAR